MTEVSVPTGVDLAGHNRISTAALSSVAQAAAAESFGVPPAEIKVSFSDSSGRLAISLATPIAVLPLTSLVNDSATAKVQQSGGSIWHRTIAAKKAVLDKVGYLTGSDVARVDIRITGVRPVQRVGTGGAPAVWRGSEAPVTSPEAEAGSWQSGRVQ